jgi:hypothetical protein
MRKELVWAGIIGISFGLIIGFGAWRVRTSITPKNKPQATIAPPVEVGQFKITIDKPDDMGVVTTNQIEVTGITKALAWVVVSTEKGDYLTQSTTDGSFSSTIDLVSGVNHIKATSLNNQGNTSSQNILVVYSASFQTSTPTPETSTSEADMARAVALKIAQAEKLPKAYIGTVTDITDATIQIKNTDSQIQQIDTNKLDVAVVNTTGTTNKAVKLTDIAIGDFIIAMGYVDGNDVLDVQRILIADLLTEPKIEVSMQKVSDVAKKTVTFEPKGDEEALVITPDNNTDIESFLDGKIKNVALSFLSTSNYVIVVTDISGTPTLTRTLFDIGPQE